MTPEGHAALKGELDHLWKRRRPEVVKVVEWAASLGDRSENADYKEGKRLLRQIDKRVRFLRKRLDNALVVDPSQQPNRHKVFFGATVTYVNSRDEEVRVKIVGVDEANMKDGKISWLSPIARALLRAEVGDEVEVRTPTRCGHVGSAGDRVSRSPKVNGRPQEGREAEFVGHML